MQSAGERMVERIATLFTALVLLVLYSPVLINALFSVVALDNGQVNWGSFSVDAYGALWTNDSVKDALRNTGIVALLAVGAATLLAVLFALYVN